MRQWFLPPGKTFISPLASSKHPVKENNFTYLEQGDLQMTAYTCSPSKPRWLCIGAGILFYIQKQKWTLSRLHGFEGKHRRYHGSGETEQWMGVISRRVALKSNLSSSDTAHTSRLWHALSLTGRPKNAYELGVSANNSHMLHRSWLLAHLTLKSWPQKELSKFLCTCLSGSDTEMGPGLQTAYESHPKMPELSGLLCPVLSRNPEGKGYLEKDELSSSSHSWRCQLFHQGTIFWGIQKHLSARYEVSVKKQLQPVKIMETRQLTAPSWNHVH